MWETPESHQLETLNPKRPTEKEQQPPTPAFHQPKCTLATPESLSELIP